MRVRNTPQRNGMGKSGELVQQELICSRFKLSILYTQVFSARTNTSFYLLYTRTIAGEDLTLYIWNASYTRPIISDFGIGPVKETL